jgi:hypothetical protein
MLDRAFRRAFRSFSTLFLVVAIVTIPAHLVFSFVFRDVIATRDIHQQISEFPNYRQVRNVGPKDLTAARFAYWGLCALEVALIPLAMRATRRVIDVEERGGVATAPDAWRHAFDRSDRSDRDGTRRFDPASLPALGVAVFVAFVLGFLIERAGLMVVEALPDDIAWAATALVQATARAGAAPFALSAFVSGRIAKEAPLVTPKLY